MKSLFKLKITTLIGLGISFSIIITYFIDPAILKFIELKSLDLKFIARGNLQPGKETVIVAIDEKSLDELGRWPWSRDIQAKLVNKLTELGARVIAFDVMFSEPEINPGLSRIRDFKHKFQEKSGTDPLFVKWLQQVEKESDTDQQFADAIRESGRTILGYFFHFSGKGLEHLGKELLENSFENIRSSSYNTIRFSANAEESVDLPQSYAVESSIAVLSKAASGAGYFSFFTDEDGAIRKIPLIVGYKDYYFPPLPIQALKLYLKEQVSFYIPEYGVENITIGDIDVPTDDKGKLLINYYGPPNTFPHYSATDILNGRVPQTSLKDKIVLIGPTAFGTYDLRLTPFNKFYPGVEIHATVIDNILHQRFLMQPGWAPMVDIFAIFLGGFIVTFFFAKASAFLSLGLTFLLGIIFLGFNYYFLFLRGFQGGIVYPLLNLIVVYVSITIYRFFTEGKEKKFIKNAFSRYLSPAVIEQLVKNPSLLNLGGERKVLTAFFSDVAGFSSISEKLSPEELVELLNIHLTEMTDIIMKYGGTVDKFEGDAIIAFFGAPVPFEDHGKRACLASLEMQQRLVELRKQWKREGKSELYMRIGLNTGPMVVGNMGSKSRMDYTIMGDSVNLASRLEGANKQYGTFSMISESTYTAAKDFVETRKLDLIRVVGKSEPVTVYELVCMKGELDPGREKQIALFHDGLSCYFDQQWDRAIDCFQAVLKGENDSPSQSYIERCKKLKAGPPKGDWDRVFTLTEK